MQVDGSLPFTYLVLELKRSCYVAAVKEFHFCYGFKRFKGIQLYFFRFLGLIFMLKNRRTKLRK